MACERMDAETYSSEDLGNWIEERFVPVRLESVEHREASRAHQVRWLPGVVVSDAEGRSHHTSIGFLPPDDLTAELAFGRGHALMAGKRYEEASTSFEEVSRRMPTGDRAPEAIYWRGVNELRRTKDFGAALRAWKSIVDDHSGSTWATKIGWMLEGVN